MAHASDALGAVIDLARIGLGMGDEFRNRVGRNRWMYLHDAWCTGDARDWCDIADEIEFELLVERRVDRVRRAEKEERVTICGRTHDRFGSDIAAGARPVVDGKWSAKPFRQPLTYQTCEYVRPALWRKADDDAHRPRR